MQHNPAFIRIFLLATLALSISCARPSMGTDTVPTPDGTAVDTPSNTEEDETLCTPGEARCSDAFGREVCSDDGMSWESDPCNPLDTCVDGVCEPPLCTPGDRRCAEDATIEECNEDGSAWELADDSCEATEICSGGTCQNLCEQALARSSYDGCEFHAVDLPQVATAEYRYDEYPFAVVIANPQEVPARVTITQAGDVITELIAEQTVTEPAHAQIGATPRSTVVYSEIRDAVGGITRLSGPAENIEVPPGAMGTFILPNSPAGMLITEDTVTYQSEVNPKAYRVSTDVPVTAYQFQPICCSQSFTNDATILFPSGSLGNRYRAVSLPTFSELPGFVSIVAGAQAADIEIDLEGHNIGTPIGFTINNGIATGRLDPYDVMTLFGRGEDANASDLTGIEIVASTEVSVMGGHTCTNIPHAYAACDHLETTLMPVASWRNEFVVAHTFHRSTRSSEMNYYRIVADSDGTVIETDPPFDELGAGGPTASYLPECIVALQDGRIQLDAGEWCDFSTRQSFIVESTDPIQLMQFLPGSQSAVGPSWGGNNVPQQPTSPDEVPIEQMGDPALTLVPPSAQFRTDYTFLTPDTYQRNFVNVLHRLGDEIYFDGINIQSNEDPERVVKMHEEPIGQSNWHLTILEVSAGPHYITTPNGPAFGLMVYAYDRDVSYAFPGGLNLTKQ